MATTFKRSMHTLPHSVPLTLQQATANPCLWQRLLDTHGQVWVSFLWDHYSFLLDPGAYKVLFVPSKTLFPQSCVSSGSSGREFQKNIYFCFDYAKAFDCVDHNKLWKILQKMGIPDHQTCLLRNQYAGQEATVRTGHGTTDWFQIGKGVSQGCILLPCLFNLYAEYIMWNSRLDEAPVGIKIAGRNINNYRHEMSPPLWQKVKKN